VKCVHIERDDTTEGRTHVLPYKVEETTDGLLPYVIGLYAGYASGRVLLGLPHSTHERCTEDFALIEEQLAELPDDQRRAVRWRGVVEALLFVMKYRAPILELADELMVRGRIEGSRVREIVERGR
jgi:hypothetical protein